MELLSNGTSSICMQTLCCVCLVGKCCGRKPFIFNTILLENNRFFIILRFIKSYNKTASVYLCMYVWDISPAVDMPTAAVPLIWGDL